MGRKRIAEGEATKVITLRLGAAEHERIGLAAAKFGKKPGEWVRLVIAAATHGALDDVPMERLVPPRNPGAIMNASLPKSGHQHVVVEGKSKSPIPKCACGAFRRADGEWVMP